MIFQNIISIARKSTAVIVIALSSGTAGHAEQLLTLWCNPHQADPFFLFSSRDSLWIDGRTLEISESIAVDHKNNHWLVETESATMLNLENILGHGNSGLFGMIDGDAIALECDDISDAFSAGLAIGQPFIEERIIEVKQSELAARARVSALVLTIPSC